MLEESVMRVRIAHLGTATVILEIDGLRIMTDPALDPKGSTYSFGFGLRSKKTLDPTLPPEGIGHIDVILLSHDQHDDNLDARGRALVAQVPRLLTTRAAAKRLKKGTALAAWETTELKTPNGLMIKVTAVPARHGPIFSTPLAGQVIGFVLEWKGQENGALYVSGDTV